MTDTMKLAKAGEKLSPKALKRMAKLYRHEPDPIIHPKSETQHGQWLCVDCGEPFQNNMMAQGHTKSHRRAWWVGTHAEEA